MPGGVVSRMPSTCPFGNPTKRSTFNDFFFSLTVDATHPFSSAWCRIWQHCQETGTKLPVPVRIKLSLFPPLLSLSLSLALLPLPLIHSDAKKKNLRKKGGGGEGKGNISFLSHSVNGIILQCGPAQPNVGTTQSHANGHTPLVVVISDGGRDSVALVQDHCCQLAFFNARFHKAGIFQKTFGIEKCQFHLLFGIKILSTVFIVWHLNFLETVNKTSNLEFFW